MSEIQSADVQAFIEARVAELKGICPDVLDMNVGNCGHKYLSGFTAWASLDDSPHRHERSIHGHGESIEEAIVALRERLAEHQAKLDEGWQCCADGCMQEAVVTTGEGRMCAHHGMAWLQSEQQSAEGPAADLG